MGDSTGKSVSSVCFGVVFSIFATAALLTSTSSAVAQETTIEELRLLEKENMELVREFNSAWQTHDSEEILKYLHEDLTFRIAEHQPRVEGKEQFEMNLLDFLSSIVSIRFDLLRIEAYGKVVITDSIHYLDRGDTEEENHMSAIFFLEDGKIREWQDYRMPTE